MTTASMDLSSRTFVYSVAIAGRLPVPCRVLHPYPEERFLRHDLRQEPYAVSLHVRICAGGQ